ncbi:MAG: alpha-mannosidase, partial [Muribaculaceae bacterium]|nr:alpha-mannosidase [Muribaculaceae bacterium]
MHLFQRIAIVTLAVACQVARADNKTVYAVSDSHLDTQWNWDVRTSIRDYLRYTLSQNLLHLSQHPDYIFNFEGGVKYAWMKEYYPEQYELMKQYIRQGRWHVAGSSWDANDVIVPSVESQIRNIMLGQNFFRKEFGVESTDIFLPDCFGFGRTLPTVARHCGLIGFSSQKIGWRIHPFFENDRKVPFGVGLWRGVDGDTIMMVHGYSYTHAWDGEDISHSKDLEKLADENANGIVYHYYGVGDRGGSPTIGSIRSVERGVRGDGPLKIISATSDRLYLDMLPYSSHPELPVYDDELLMDVHGNGCYTAMSVMKFYNRQNELLGDAAERAVSAAAIFARTPYPTESFTESWKRFIWHQFHDDITGTSEPPCYEISFNDELLSLKQFSDLLTDAASSISDRLNTDVSGIPILLFNPLGYETTDIVELQLEAKRRPASAVVKDHNGRLVKAQITGYDNGKATLLIEATVPAVGFAVYDVVLKGKGADKTVPVSTIENSVYSLAFDRYGDISSIIDKRNGRQLVAEGKTVRLAMFADNVSTMWPAWEIQKETIDREPVSFGDDAEVSLVADGVLLKRVKVTKRYGDSEFTQYINLYEGALAPRIDIVNEIEWQSPASLLKAEFPLTVFNRKATYDLGLGVIERGNNVTTAYEVPAREWVDLSDEDYGVTLLSNYKYGWDKPSDNTLRLTLFHSPGVSNRYSHQERQDFGHHEFTYSIVGHSGR